MQYPVYIATSLLIASFFSFFYKSVNMTAFIGFGLLCLILGLWKREYALYLAFLELTLGSFGYLLHIQANGLNLSLRMAFFAVIMGLYIIDILRKKTYILYSKFYIPIAFFGAIWLFGVFHGYFAGYGLNNVFFDANAYLYLLLIFPALSYINTREKLNGALKVILVGAATTAALTFGLFLIFTHSGSRDFLQIIYKWIRDLRIGEITPLDNGAYRIFLQSQIYIIVALFFVSTQYFYKNIKFGNFFILGALYSGAIYLSLSRSFWVGAVIGLIVLSASLFFTKKKIIKPIFQILSVIFIGILIADLLTPKNLLKNRFLIGEAATDTRVSQFEVLIPAITVNPILGYGFGKTLTYKSFDPRLGDSANGVLYTTDAFELGYLDMLLKFGLLGLAALFYFLWMIIRPLLKSIKTSPDSAWLLASLAALLAIHIFTPYLNHPLGIGILILGGVVADIDRNDKKA